MQLAEMQREFMKTMASRMSTMEDTMVRFMEEVKKKKIT
jgi:hypothetical protein